MSSEEVENSVICPREWDKEDLFIKTGNPCMKYMYDEEVEIITDESE